MKTVLITGGAGFIGSHLAEHLLKTGYEVIVIDNFYTGRKRNVIHLFDYENFELIRHNVWEAIYLEVDEIYNLACPASPIHYQERATATTKTAVLGAINMLGLASRVGARILQASTSEIYGDPKHHPQSEQHWGNVNTIGIRACYDEGKRCAETLFFDYHRERQTDIRVARIFNTYGPNMASDDGRVVSNFINQALRNSPITIYGDGSQTRSFCYVDDLVGGLTKLMDQEGHTGPVNLGNDAEITVLELANLIIELTNSTSKIQRKNLPEDDPVRRRPDLRLAREILDYEPKVDLITGLQKTIKYFEMEARECSGK